MAEMGARSEEALNLYRHIARDQKIILDRGRRQNAERLVDMQGKARDADRIIKLILDSRIAEKKYQVSMDPHLEKKVTAHLEAIGRIAAAMAEKFRFEEEQKQAREIIRGGRNYGEAFKQYAHFLKSRAAEAEQMNDLFFSLEQSLSRIVINTDYALNNLRETGRDGSPQFGLAKEVIAISNDTLKWLWTMKLEELNYEITGEEEFALNVEELLLAADRINHPNPDCVVRGIYRCCQ